MKYDRLKLIEKLDERMAALKVNKDNTEAKKKYLEEIKAFKVNALADARAYVANVKRWKPGVEDYPKLAHRYLPQKPMAYDNSHLIKRLETLKTQLELCADDKIDVRPHDNYNLIHEVFNS